jgi:hypothetical protein
LPIHEAIFSADATRLLLETGAAAEAARNGRAVGGALHRLLAIIPKARFTSETHCAHDTARYALCKVYLVIVGSIFLMMPLARLSAIIPNVRSQASGRLPWSAWYATW